MITVSNFSLSRLNNAEITGLFINTQKLLTDAERPNLGIENADYLAFTQKLQQLVDQTYVSTASSNTADMQAADAKRSVIYKRIRLKLSMAELAESGSALAALTEKVRADFMSKYLSKVATMAMHEKTAVIQGFILDLNNKLDEDEQELLGIEGDVTRLEQANNAFIAAYQARTSEKAVVEAEKTKRLRAELIEMFQGICIVLQFYANSTIEANATKAAACDTFIRQLNVLLGEAKTRFLQRTSKSESSTSGSSGTGGTSGGQNTPAGGDDTPAGGNENPDTPAGGDDNPGGGDDTPSSENPSSTPGDGVYHDGVTEF